jgi:hypothetical protein
MGAIVNRGSGTDGINDTNIFTHVYVPTLFIVGSKDNKVLK